MLFLFTGSFDPVHTGHLSLIQELLTKHPASRVIIAPIVNPLKQKAMFSLEERCVLLQAAVKNFFWKDKAIQQNIVIDCELSRITFTIDQAEYVKQKYYEQPIIVFGPDYSKEDIVKFNRGEELLKTYKLYFVRGNKELSSTDIRNLIINQDWKTLANLYVARLPHVFNIIRSLRAPYDPATPKVAIDAIIFHITFNRFVLIERKYPPYGLSLVGGFVDYGESLNDAVKREIFEETALQTVSAKHIACLENIADTRHSVITNLFFVYATGNPKASDDAKAIKLVTLDELKAIKDKLVLGHSKLVDIFLEKLEEGTLCAT